MKVKVSVGVSLLILLLVACSNGPEEEKVKWTGMWTGAIQASDQPIDIRVTFQKEEGSLQGEISIPDRQIESFPLTEIKQENDQITFNMALSGQDLVFTGEREGDVLKGDFNQYQDTTPFRLEKGE